MSAPWIFHALRPMAAATMLLALTLGVSRAAAGEKAIITVPSKPGVDPAASRPARPFEPLDPGTSVGGASTPSQAPMPQPPPVPNARTQKELIERFDRQRNWLLDDPDRMGKSDSQSRWLPSLEETDYTTDPRRPRTVLERRLRSDNGGATSTATSDRRETEDSSNAPQDAGSGWDLFDSRTESTGRQGLDASWNPSSSSTSGFGNPGFGERSPWSLSPAPAEGRMVETSRPGRGSTLDPYARERQERYDRVFSNEGFIGRSSSLENSAEQLRAREQRTDAFSPALKNPAATPISASISSPETESLTDLSSRSRLGGTSASASAITPYLPARDPEPYVSPAARMLHAPPVQPPRFRP
ncbi:MAG: hypothetical protein KIT22_11595 [Verrucomicrobiae bacterium]|nr:hypothetical protein [Verrucomicrobiae bacterium]